MENEMHEAMMDRLYTFEENVGDKVAVLGYALKALSGNINVAKINKFGRTKMSKERVEFLLGELTKETLDIAIDSYADMCEGDDEEEAREGAEDDE